MRLAFEEKKQLVLATFIKKRPIFNQLIINH